ncbi:MAG: hypothetical protein IPO91_32005 [Chloroflexi bacterium]|nr:hypothetical protein [Chloroflexota bacterium]
MDETNLDQLKARIGDFLQSHRSKTQEIASKLSNIFEAYCYVLFVLHYEQEGLKPRIENLTPDKQFKFRFSTAGHPWNFSYFSVRRADNEDEVLFEIRHNQQVAGHYVKMDEKSEEDIGLFALDVAVVKPGALPRLAMGTKRNGERTYVTNNALITFGEAKKLVAYPMLIASFYGVVHEIRPVFLEKATQDEEFEKFPHPYPILFTSDFLTRGTKNILKTFEDRQLRVTVVENVNASPESVLLRRIKGIREDEPLNSRIEEALDEITNSA